MLSVLDYRLYESRRIVKLSLVWLLFITFIILFLVIFQNKIQICNYYLGTGVINENGKLEVTTNNIKDIVNNKTMIINDIKYDYDVVSIDDYNSSITLAADIPVKVSNNIIDFKILIYKKNAINYIFEVIGGVKNVGTK